MDFNTLKTIFHEHAVNLGESKESTAKFRSASYDRVAHRLENDFKPSDKVSKEKIESMNISDYMKKKALEFASGKVPKIKKTKKKTTKKKVRRLSKSPVRIKPALIKELSEFMGLGPERAQALIDAGLKTVNQIHTKKFKAMLPEETKAFIDLKPIQKIPHEHIQILEPYITGLPLKATVRIVGSYRREKPFSSDIDVMIVSSDVDIIEKFLSEFKSALAGKVYPYSVGRDKLSVIADMSESKLLDEAGRVYKLDIFRTLPEHEIPMLLYSTGSAEFNIAMRGRAKKKGYLLNQKGLFKDTKRIDNLDTEEDYFKILGMPYRQPVDRN